MIQEKIIAFLLSHSTYFLKSILRQYPFSRRELHKYKDILDWSIISQNCNISWDFDLISEFQEQINWFAFSLNTNAFKDKSLIDIFSEKIHWNAKYGNIYIHTIAENKGIRWDLETIEKYETKIDFELLSTSENVEWSEALLEKYLNKWDLVSLGDNDSIPWTLELFEKYLNIDYLEESIIMCNKSLVNFEFIEKYKDILSWDIICSNDKLPWKEKKLLERWSDNIDWLSIAENEFFFRDDKNFFHKHYEIWHENTEHYFDCFSGNKAFPWTKTLIEKYKSYLNWEKLCTNEGIAWNLDLINYFSEYVIWGGLTQVYESKLINNKMVKVKDYLQVNSGLIENKSVLWSIELLESYETKLTTKLMLLNTAIWEKAFMPYVDEKMIDEIIPLMKISNK